MSEFHHKTGFSQVSQILFMFQCNMHVEMNKFLCSLACTWMTIIDSQFISLTAYLKMVHLNEMLTWWLPSCKLIITNDSMQLLVPN